MNDPNVASRGDSSRVPWRELSVALVVAIFGLGGVLIGNWNASRIQDASFRHEDERRVADLRRDDYAAFVLALREARDLEDQYMVWVIAQAGDPSAGIPVQPDLADEVSSAREQLTAGLDALDRAYVGVALSGSPAAVEQAVHAHDVMGDLWEAVSIPPRRPPAAELEELEAAAKSSEDAFLTLVRSELG